MGTTAPHMSDDPLLRPVLDRDAEPTSDERLTAMGLLVEAYTGVRGAVETDLEPGGLNASEFEVLIRLARSPQRRLQMSALARQSIVSNSGLTRVVDRLCDAGLVERERHDGDRRIYYAVLTDEGSQRLDAVLPAHLAVIHRTITGVLSDDELRSFIRSLRKIRAVVNPAADPDQPAATATATATD